MRSLAFDGNQPGAYLRLVEMALRRKAYDEAITLADRGLAVAAAEGQTRGDLYVAQAIAHASLESEGAARDALDAALAASAEHHSLLEADPVEDPGTAHVELRARLPR